MIKKKYIFLVLVFSGIDYDIKLWMFFEENFYFEEEIVVEVILNFYLLIL